MVITKGPKYSGMETILFRVRRDELETAQLRFIRAMHDAIKYTANIDKSENEAVRKVADDFMALVCTSGYDLELKEDMTIGAGWLAVRERIRGLEHRDLANEFYTAVKYYACCTEIGDGGKRVVVSWRFAGSAN